MQTLLVDDDPFVLRVLWQQLSQLGWTNLLPCESARDALALMESSDNQIDLVFCDLQMPDIDGVEFVRHLARLEYRGSLVLVSGEDSRIVRTAQMLAEAHSIRVLGAVAKPVPNETLQMLLLAHSSARLRAATVGQGNHGSQPLSVDELRTAIEGGELLLHYQPKVDFESARLVGAEALVRWQHPQAGLIYPDKFIGVAEESGLIDALTRSVLTKALAQARQWKDAGLDLQVAVNVSMDNLAALDFPDIVAQLAVAAGIELPRIMLEVTESRLMTDRRAPLDILARLRLKRIGLSIDDFGTGHSSLSQLRDVPFDELKLDRSFISGATGDAQLAAIVKGTLAMARQLGIKTVAEGIEDRNDWDFLRGLQCDVAQGYFIARPMAGEQLIGWHAGWQQRQAALVSAVPFTTPQ